MSGFIVNPYRFQASAFLPTDVSGLVLWADMNDISTLWQDSAKTTAVTSDADPVGAVADKSSSGNDLLQSNTSIRPSYETGEIGGKPALYNSGPNYLEAAFTLNQPHTCFVVCKALEASTASDQLIGGYSANAGVIYRGTSTTLRLYSGTLGPVITVNSTESLLVTAIFNGASSSIERNNDGAVTGNAGTTAPGGIKVFNSSANNKWLTGYIGEILMYNTTPSAGDISSIKDYLIAKWSL